MEYDYEKQYDNGNKGITLQWKEKSSKARIYLKLDHQSNVSLHEVGDGRELGEESKDGEAVKRLRTLFGINS